ncbi:hypothetical protein OAF55_03225 [Akkermansiaceae bacterium]|nr:hypothetical protein [Akkermansiaceae bacterium]
MKVLFITSSYTTNGNSAVIRHNALVKGFIQMGCDVDVYTVKWPEEDRSNYFLTENNGNIHYSDLPVFARSGSLKKRIKISEKKLVLKIKTFLSSLLYYPDICKQWKSIIEVKNPSQYDFMVSSSFNTSSHFVGKKIKTLCPSLFWIQTWGDPWFYDDLVSPWYLKPLIFLHEYKLLESADKIVYVSSPTAELMKQKRKVFASKITYIPRSYYSEIKKGKKIEEQIVVTYTGNLTRTTGRDILEFVNAVKHYNSNNEVKIFMQLYCPLIDRDIKEKLTSQQFIIINEGVDFDRIGEIYKRSDALLFISNKGGTSMIPGKFYDYLGTDLPIICLMSDITDNVTKFVKGFGGKCIVIENNMEMIVNKLISFRFLLFKKYPVIESYSPKNVATEYLELYLSNQKKR